MEKYLVTIEFRYHDAPRHEDDYTSRSNKITIGVYDDFDKACENGNKVLENLESKFDLHEFPNGKGFAKRERFSKNGGCFGGKKDLVTNLAYLRTPFQFFVKISTLKYGDVDSVIDDVVDSVERYKKHQKSLEVE